MMYRSGRGGSMHALFLSILILLYLIPFRQAYYVRSVLNAAEINHNLTFLQWLRSEQITADMEYLHRCADKTFLCLEDKEAAFTGRRRRGLHNIFCMCTLRRGSEEEKADNKNSDEGFHS